MAAAGADIIGLNCNFDPFTLLETMTLMKAGLAEAGLEPHLMLQPCGYRVPDGGLMGLVNLPEFPYGNIGH